MRAADVSVMMAREHARTHLSRRRLLQASAGVAGLAAAATVLRPFAAVAADPLPKPIKGGLGPFHVNLNAYRPDGPPAVFEQSTITDFRGGVASTDVTGWGKDGDGNELYFRCDMRLMKGEYVARDGVRRNGSFGFI
jgi:hypothetical protein